MPEVNSPGILYTRKIRIWLFPASAKVIGNKALANIWPATITRKEVFPARIKAGNFPVIQDEVINNVPGLYIAACFSVLLTTWYQESLFQENVFAPEHPGFLASDPTAIHEPENSRNNIFPPPKTGRGPDRICSSKKMSDLFRCKKYGGSGVSWWTVLGASI